jgi:hypothetical protein
MLTKKKRFFLTFMKKTTKGTNGRCPLRLSKNPQMNFLCMRLVSSTMVASACEGTGRSVRGLALLSAASRDARAAVLLAVELGRSSLRASPTVLSEHVVRDLRSLDAYSLGKCLLCGRRKRDVKRTHLPLLVVHPTCVHRSGSFVKLSSVIGRRSRRSSTRHEVDGHLVLRAKAVSWYECVLSEPHPAFQLRSVLGWDV